MSKMLSVLLIVLTGTVLILPFTTKTKDSIRSSSLSSQEKIKEAQASLTIPKTQDLLALADGSKTSEAKRIVILEARNTVVLRGPITSGSVAKAIREVSKVSRDIGKGENIYLVLDTPGGSILDGVDFIDFLAALPQKVTTVTLFAASMGFQIVENNPGERLISRSGILMSHRAKGGVEGQFDGELESEYRMIKRQIDYIETVDANRMGISLPEYKKAIKDEMWIHGFDAKEHGVADETVLVRCGDSMEGTDVVTISTMFGDAVVSFDKCPLIKEPVSVQLGQIRNDAKSFLSAVIGEAFNNETQFTKDYIVTDKFKTIFK